MLASRVLLGLMAWRCPDIASRSVDAPWPPEVP
jgi:hypothetical protein